MVFEAVYLLERTSGNPRSLIASAFTELLALPNLHCRDKELLQETLDLWVKETPLSFADCYHRLYARHLGLA